jgi:glutamate racemase
MAIGVFDSGIGGLSIHRELVRRLPDADFVYLADQAMTPYGGRPGEEIVALTRAGCERLFAQGCDLVILACNTAAAVALRRLQQTWLPDYRKRIGRAVNVLGIIVPTIEAATGLPWEHEAAHKEEKIERLDVLGIFCTPATAASRVYEIEIDKRRQDLAVFCEACPGLAGAIEADGSQADLAGAIDGHVANLTRRIGRPPDRAILGCTHYEITADLFRAALPAGTPLIHQPEATAMSVQLYLSRHPEYDRGQSQGRRFLTTGQSGRQNGLAERFWGGALTFEAI